MSTGKRPKRDMGKDWVRLTVVCTKNTADWIASEAKRRNTSKTALADEILTKAKWKSRVPTDKI